MKTQWIVENLVKEPSFAELTKAIKELGYPLIEINGDYSADMLRTKLKLLWVSVANIPVYDNQCVMVNGSIKMCKLLGEELKMGCYPITFSSFEKYKCSSYYSHFGEYLFNDKYCMMSLKELVRQKYAVWGNYSKDNMLFIRPDSGEKSFQAGLVDIVDLSTLWESNKDVEHELILVSTPKQIHWEGRFVVSKERGIIASSTYRFMGKTAIIPSVPVEATKFCKELLKVDYHPDPVYCLDICQDSDKNCWLMEVTSFSCAGLYATDKTAIVKAVSEIAEEEYEKHHPKPPVSMV